MNTTSQKNYIFENCCNFKVIKDNIMNNSESNQNDIINKLDTMLVKYQILEKKIEYISNNINKIQAQMNNFFDYFNDIVNITTNQIKR